LRYLPDERIDGSELKSDVMKPEKPIRYVRVNAYTWIGTQPNVTDEQVLKRFYENQKLSPYYNPKKFFTIK